MSSADNQVLDVFVVGAGFAGLYMLHRARKAGFSAQVVEAGPDVGGVWFWNGYPGARCDVESMQYSYGFDDELQQEWSWSEKFATRDEIMRYVNYVADRLDLRSGVKVNTRVTAAHYSDVDGLWDVATSSGESYRCRYLIMATGALSSTRIPPIPGLETFKGEVLHTGNWPRDRQIDFAGKRVAVIGTGSSGIQVITAVAPEAERLTVFQRTANYSVPMRNRPMTPEYERQWKDRYPELRHEARYNTTAGTIYELSDRSALEATPEEREAEFERRWQIGSPNFLRAFKDISLDEEANEFAAEFVRRKIRETVKDPETAAKLIPTSHPIGSKRICVDNHYFEVFNRDNVGLVSIKEEPIVEITQNGIRTSAAEYPLDAIVFATGYDAITGPLNAIDIRGREGRLLKDEWRDGPSAYLGLMASGFPNMFIVTGPGSPSVLVNVINAIEQHVEFIGDCLTWLRDNDLDTIEPDPEAQEKWADHVDEVANATLMVRGNSWYMGANIEGKPVRFMPYAGGIGPYAKKCQEIVQDGYKGFVVSHHSQAATANAAE
ncbi:flavin-containing monooxygenase [Novosphingobium pentaromativorans]|nr:NAD(P)/FAD-dependent oxidoreductase [Novosphingobium pentaromativorans]